MTRIFCLSLLMILNSAGLWAGDKKAIALGEIQWQAPLTGRGYRYTRVETKHMVGSLQTMVTTALTQCRKFEVVERAQLSQIVAELGLIHDSGLVDPGAINKNPEWGRLSGIHWLVLGSVTQFSIDVSGFSASKLSVGMNKETMMLEVDLRVIDVESGRIIDAVPLRTKVNLSMNLNSKETGAIGGQQSAGQKTATLLRSCANQLVHRIVANTLPIRVIDGDKEGLVLNYGQGLLQVDDELTVFRPGEIFVDPDTGEQEAELIEVGRVFVFQTQKTFSKAKSRGKGARSFNAGDICKLSDEIGAESHMEEPCPNLKNSTPSEGNNSRADLTPGAGFPHAAKAWSTGSICLA